MNVLEETSNSPNRPLKRARFGDGLFSLDIGIDPVVRELFPELPTDFPAFPVWNASTLRWHTRMDLPLRIYGTIFMARPDSGCEDNIVDERTVAALGIYVDRSASNQKIFRMANGRSVQAVGMASVTCHFPNEPWKELQTQFYVFARLNTPMIVGLSFLDDTKTLVENRHRLQPRESSSRGPFKVSRVNRTKRWLRCLVNFAPVLANPDTGSDIDLMSLEYVKKRGFQWQPIEADASIVEFADGSTAQLSGKLVASVAICSDAFATETMTFYILENLTCDMLFGEDFLQMKDVFRLHTTALTSHEMDMSIADANTILWQRKREARLLRFFSGGRGNEPNAQELTDLKYDSRQEPDLEANDDKSLWTSEQDGGHGESVREATQKEIIEEEGRELNRREQAAKLIERLSGPHKESARSAEEVRLIRWDAWRASVNIAPPKQTWSMEPRSYPTKATILGDNLSPSGSGLAPETQPHTPESSPRQPILQEIATKTFNETYTPPLTPDITPPNRPFYRRPMEHRVAMSSPDNTYRRALWDIATKSSADISTATLNPHEVSRAQSVGQRVAGKARFHGINTPPRTPTQPDQQPIRQRTATASSSNILPPARIPDGVKQQSVLVAALEPVCEPFFCSFGFCEFGRRRGKGFSTEKDLDRHLISTHTNEHVCPLCLGENRVFLRADHLQRHIKGFHGMQN